MPAAAVGEAAAYPRDQRRFRRIVFFFSYNFLQFLVWEFGLRWLLGEAFVARGRERRTRRVAIQFRKLALEMGGVMIKLGQFISTRVDILPVSVIRELEGLQDEVTPLPFDQIQQVIMTELGDRLQDFDSIDPLPIAAASLGQVYRARLEGDQVVIKVQRPGIRLMVNTDLAALAVVARWGMNFKFFSRRANLPELMEEFSNVLWEELDYLAEANHAERFARMFAEDPGVYVPFVYRAYSTRRVIVLEDVTAIKINDYSALEAAGINRTEVARRLLDTYLNQVFVERFFHADPHPGNIFVRPLPLDQKIKMNGSGKYITGNPFAIVFVDYGMTGKLTPQLVETLRQTMIAGGLRDARGLVKGYEQLGLLMPDSDRERIIEAVSRALDVVWGLNMSEIGSLPREELMRFSKEFRDLLFSLPFRIPQNMIYLGRCAGILSGMCTGLDPNFDPWQEVQPYVQKLMEGRTSEEAPPKHRPWANWRDFWTTENLRTFVTEDNLEVAFNLSADQLRRTIQLPVLMEEVLRKIERGDVQTRLKLDTELQARFERLEAQNRRLLSGMIFSSLMISSAIFWHGKRKS